jgi:predicted DNA-binding transcriptional regulator AlpA
MRPRSFLLEDEPIPTNHAADIFARRGGSRCQYFIDLSFRLIYDLCMMQVMVKEADLNLIEVPDDYEVLDATALGRRLGFKRDTVLAYLSRRNFRRIPRPNRLLAMGPIWYEKSVREWQVKEDQARGK